MSIAIHVELRYDLRSSVGLRPLVTRIGVDISLERQLARLNHLSSLCLLYLNRLLQHRLAHQVLVVRLVFALLDFLQFSSFGILLFLKIGITLRVKHMHGSILIMLWGHDPRR